MRTNFWQGHAPNQALVAISRLSPSPPLRVANQMPIFLHKTPLFLNSQTSQTVRYTFLGMILFHAKNGIAHNAIFYFRNVDSFTIRRRSDTSIYEIPPHSSTRPRRPQPPYSTSKRKTRQITSHSAYVRHTLMFAPLQRGWGGRGSNVGRQTRLVIRTITKAPFRVSPSQCGLRDEAGPRRWTWGRRSGSPR